jgi:D-alanyl-D-alanine carboxypeptidase (penicillin-binding protein 4)
LPGNRLKLVDEACGDWREKFSVNVNGSTLELVGNFPASCGEKTLYLSPWSADMQVERLFRALWSELGGHLHGKVREGLAPSTAIPLAVHESPPLAEIVREVNKYSNNVMARQIFLSLDTARPASSAGAQQRVLGWLADKDCACRNWSSIMAPASPVMNGFRRKVLPSCCWPPGRAR